MLYFTQCSYTLKNVAILYPNFMPYIAFLFAFVISFANPPRPVHSIIAISGFCFVSFKIKLAAISIFSFRVSIENLLEIIFSL